MQDDGTSFSELSSHLWESANILRGPVDAADFKTYIFPLLFFKRVSDVFDEELIEALDESGGDQQYALFPENHRFQVPEDRHWADVRKTTANVGQALQRAMREIEKANPDTLYGIFGDAQWTNKERLSDELLRDLIEHFSKLPLGNRSARADILGRAYEYLIKKFADATNPQTSVSPGLLRSKSSKAPRKCWTIEGLHHLRPDFPHISTALSLNFVRSDRRSERFVSLPGWKRVPGRGPIRLRHVVVSGEFFASSYAEAMSRSPDAEASSRLTSIALT